MAKVTVIETSKCGQFTLKQIGDEYYIYKGNRKLKAPKGNIAVTTNLTMAKTWLEDFSNFGTNFELNPDNRVAWHFTYIDLFAATEKEELIEKFYYNFLVNGKRDCAFDSELPESLYELAGGALIRKTQIKDWLDSCNKYQLCAISNISNFFRSANISAMFALCLDKYKDKDQEEKLEEIFGFLKKKFGGMYYGMDYFAAIDLFKFYYNLEIPAEQPKVIDIFEPYEKPYDSKIGNIIGRKFSPELIAGNNYFLYIDGKMSPNQPYEYSLPDIPVNKKGKSFCQVEKENNLKDLLPPKCWVKHFFDRWGTNGYYIVYIEIDESTSTIKDIGCLKLKSRKFGEFLNCFGPDYYLGGNGPYDRPEIYEKISYTPNFIFDNLYFLNDQIIYLPSNFSLIGKPLPKCCEGDLNGNNECFEICYSPYRITFCVLILSCDSNHIIQKVYYNSYATDSFYNKTNELREITGTDLKEEYTNVLHKFLLNYSDDEFKALL